MTTEERLYQLAGQLVPYLKKAEIMDVAEDYAEHLETCQGEPESPKSFAKAALGDGKSRYRRPWLIAVAAVVLLAAWEVCLLPYYYDTDGRWIMRLVNGGIYPALLWVILGCGSLLPYANRSGRNKKWGLGISAGLLALAAGTWFGLNWMMANVMTEPEGLKPGFISMMYGEILRTLSLLAVLILFVALWAAWRRSPWYFCVATQALALLRLCRGIWYYLTCMDLDFVPTPYLPVLECAGSFLVATLGTIVSAAAIVRGAGKRGV